MFFPPRYLENVIENCQSKTEWEREKKMRHQWPLPTYCLSASLICSWRETSTSLHSLTTAPSVDEDVPPPSDYTHTWELTSTDCSSVNLAADIYPPIIRRLQQLHIAVRHYEVNHTRPRISQFGGGKKFSALTHRLRPPNPGPRHCRRPLPPSLELPQTHLFGAFCAKKEHTSDR